MGMKKYGPAVICYLVVVGVFLSGAWFAGRTVTVMAQRAPVEGRRTIVIDAGHGGEDGGAVSCTGVAEKEINLEIALRLNDLFHLLGWRTRMIRSEDISVYTDGQTIAQKKVSDLKNRVRIVQETEDPILVSIHQNLFSDSKYRGAQVFYAPEGEGHALAKAMQQALVQTLNPGSRREVKPADGVYLMEHAGCTSILVECGFLSNPEEEAMLRTAEYQKKLCCVIGASVAEFLDCQT